MRLVLSSRTRRAVPVVMLCGALALQSLVPQPASAGPRSTVFRMVNDARRSHGRRPLHLSASISALAARHSSRMAGSGTLFHSRCLDCIRRRHGWSAIGENVGYAGSARTVERLFMHSPPHRSNLLCRCFRTIGIGIVRGHGRVWVTQLFYRP